MRVMKGVWHAYPDGFAIQMDLVCCLVHPAVLAGYP